MSNAQLEHASAIERLAPRLAALRIGLCPRGKQGELWLRRPYIMKSYTGNPEATSATLDDGWLRTGDLCYIDNEGFLYVIDRLKELIKYKGYQVAPAELEQLLHTHPEISDAAVIPYPDDVAGQVPMAFVVRQPQSSLDEAQVIDFVAKQVLQIHYSQDLGSICSKGEHYPKEGYWL